MSAANVRTRQKNIEGDEKPSGSIRSPKIDLEFEFVAYSTPDQIISPETRKVIRSHVTKRQHVLEGRRSPPGAIAKRQSSVGDVEDFSLLSEQSRSLPEATLPSPETPGPTSRASSVGVTLTETHNARPERKSLAQEAPEGPQAWSWYIMRYIDALESNIDLELPGLAGESQSAVLREHLFPLFYSSSTSFRVAALIAYSHHIRTNRQQMEPTLALRLHGIAIASINSALDHPDSCRRDDTLVAVALMAKYEALFGNKSHCSTHLFGLAHLLRSRGKAAQPNCFGVLEKYLFFIDSNVAHIVGCRRYLDPFEFMPTRSYIGHPDPDVKQFTAGGLAG